MRDKVILHSDANAFYASVECALNPELKGKAVAVCGSEEDRHGIVLAKSELAKRAGIKTGMTNWKARRLCPELVIVPPRHKIYKEYSERLHEIYLRYTDFVEPYGLDECWLDVTSCNKPALEIANELREIVKGELGITVSVGVSFNKAFAKLGSDMKKPDAVTLISRENFRELVWRLPCSEMLFCGPSTTEKLKNYGIKTIGEIANCSPQFLSKLFGKNGERLFDYANGNDRSPVARYGQEDQAKSVGHGVTCVSDLKSIEETRGVIVSLTQEIGRRLRQSDLQARGVQVTVRNSDLKFESWQELLASPTQSGAELATASVNLLKKRYVWRRNIRALTVSAIHLESAQAPCQLSMFSDTGGKRKKVEETLDKIKDKFGENAIRPAVLLEENKLPDRSSGRQAPPP